jgi:NADPH-dependent 2,4-dienoyl-CoA reductase/sulfur reductase-like enzyme
LEASVAGERVVVVGGGAAGMSAASAARRADPEAEIVVLESTGRLVHEPAGRLLGAQLVGPHGVAKRLDVIATALRAGFEVDDLAALDLSYAPPYAPVYDPVLLAAQAATPAPGAFR